MMMAILAFCSLFSHRQVLEGLEGLPESQEFLQQAFSSPASQHEWQECSPFCLSDHWIETSFCPAADRLALRKNHGRFLVQKCTCNDTKGLRCHENLLKLTIGRRNRINFLIFFLTINLTTLWLLRLFVVGIEAQLGLRIAFVFSKALLLYLGQLW